MVFETVLQADLSKPVQVKQLSGNFFSSDNNANKITVEVFDKGVPVIPLDGATAYIIRSDGTTVPCTENNGCGHEGNKAWVILPSAAYVSPGQISVVIKCGSTTVCAVTTFVYKTTTSTIVDPSHIIPDIEELLEKISDCEAATQNANTATLAAISATADAEAAAGSVNSAILAAQSATARADVATLAATSATSAANTATLAASSATAGANTATQSANTATLAATSATAGANSATLAAVSATAGANSATQATQSATANAITATTAANSVASYIGGLTVVASTVSPSASATATLSTESGHAKISFEIPKGESGNETIDDTKGIGDTDFVWSADQTDKLYGIQDDRTNELLGLVNYGYDEYFKFVPGETTATNVTAIRNKTLVYLNGSPTGSYLYFKLNNTPARTSATSVLDDFGTPTYFTEGHKYRITVTRLSGSCTFNGENAMPIVNIYKQGMHTQPLTSVVCEDSNVAILEFTATDDPCQVVMIRTINSVFTNFKCSVVMQDLNALNVIDKFDEKANSIDVEEDVNAPVATFEDGAEDMPMEVTVGVDASQDLHGYDHPWVGGNGKNIFPNEWSDSSTSANVWRSLGFPVDLNTNTYYTFSNLGNHHKEYIIAYDANDTKLGRTVGAVRATHTISKNSFTQDQASGADFDTIAYLKIHFYDWSGVTKEDLIALNIQCEIGDTATEWEPYENICPISGWTGANVTVSPTSNPDDPDKEVYFITFPSEAGTVYGGSLTVNKDGTGTLVVDKGMSTIPEISVINDSTKAGSTGKLVNWTVSAARYEQGVATIMFENAKGCNYADSGAAYTAFINSNKSINMYVPTNATVQKVNNALQGSKIVYELATPVTYTLPAPVIRSLLGTNNIWADTGNIISMSYAADTKLYIDNLTKPTEDDMIANENIPTDTYFTINNTLYKSTEAIAQGETINPNTGGNCIETSVAEVFNSLLSAEGVSF